MKRQPLSESLDSMLTNDAIQKGYSLDWWAPEAFKKDPVILYRKGFEVYRWDFIPSLTVVLEKVEELELDK